MGMRRSKKTGVQLIRQIQIIDELAAPGQQGTILTPGYRLTDATIAIAITNSAPGACLFIDHLCARFGFSVSLMVTIA